MHRPLDRHEPRPSPGLFFSFRFIKESSTITAFIIWLASAWKRETRRPPPPEHPSTPRLIIVGEGGHDIEFLRRLSSILHTSQPAVPDLAAYERRGELLFVPAGGGDFRPWLTRLSALGRAEFYLFDRETPPVSQQREQWAAALNVRPGCRAFVTRRRCLENYLHVDAIREGLGVTVEFSSHDDVAETVARKSFRPSAEFPTRERLSRRAKRRQRDRIKQRLNSVAVERMTFARLAAVDPAGEVFGWFTVMGERLADEANDGA